MTNAIGDCQATQCNVVTWWPNTGPTWMWPQTENHVHYHYDAVSVNLLQNRISEMEKRIAELEAKLKEKGA